MEATSSYGNIQNKLKRRRLFENAMQGKWKDVVDMYQKWSWLGRERITKEGNTALHIAVSDRQVRFVEQLVGVIIEPDVLGIQNKQGNTPLHLAASIGNVSMCKCILLRRRHLAGVPNEEGETPLFLAARHGKMDAFFCLLTSDEYVYTRNKKGETILHCAINGGHFKLAFLILKRYPHLFSTFNEEGATPLHVLANKPGAFRSGTHLSLLGKLIYHCVLVPTEEDDEDKTSPNWFTGLWNKIGKTTDEANNIPQGTESLPQRTTDILEERSINIPNEGARKAVGSGTHFPPNYDTCFSFISLLNKAIWDILSLGTGLNYIHNIKKKKERNILSVEVMNKLLTLQQDQMHNYDRAGWNVDYAERTMLYWDPDSEEEKQLEQYGETGLPEIDADISDNSEREQGKGDKGISKEKLRKEGSSEKEKDEGAFKKTQKSNDSLEEDGGTGLPSLEDLSAIDKDILENSQREQRKGDEAISKEKPRKEGSSDMEKDEGTFKKTQKSNNSWEEDSNWALLLRLGKASLRADPIIVAGRAAKKLDDELYMETEKKNGKMERWGTPILIAAKNGITEMVNKILEIYPLAIHDIDSEGKNVVLLAVENRHPHVYELLLKKNILRHDVFRAVDNNGCSALHLAAMSSDNGRWLFPGAALQIQWDITWYKYVKRSMPPNFFPSHNKIRETANQILTRDHKDMVQKGRKWLTSIATSCSVVATLIATVAFATSTAVPGSTREGSGKPNLEQQAAFNIFAISSLIALFFSVLSTVMFLAVLTSRHQGRDFGRDLPTKLLLGLIFLFISILSILLTFCAGHFFLLKDELRIAAIPVYAVMCLPAACFAGAQLPLFTHLIWATFSKVPRRWVDEDT